MEAAMIEASADRPALVVLIRRAGMPRLWLFSQTHQR